MNLKDVLNVDVTIEELAIIILGITMVGESNAVAMLDNRHDLGTLEALQKADVVLEKLYTRLNDLFEIAIL